MKAINPSIIYGQIEAYDHRDTRVGFDAILQAETGFMSMNGMPGGPPVKMPVALIDILAGHQLKEGILLALLARSHKQEGTKVVVSLFETAIASLANQATNYLMANHVAKQTGSEHPNIAPYGELFQTKDGVRIIVAIGSPRQWEAFCTALDLPWLMQDAKFENNALRVQNRRALAEAISAKISLCLSTEVIAICKEVNVPIGKINSMDAVFAQPQAQAMVIKKQVNGQVFASVPTFIAKMQDNPDQVTHFTPPPSLGEHTNAILIEFLGLKITEVEVLRQKSIVF